MVCQNVAVVVIAVVVVVVIVVVVDNIKTTLVVVLKASKLYLNRLFATRICFRVIVVKSVRRSIKDAKPYKLFKKFLKYRVVLNPCLC